MSPSSKGPGKKARIEIIPLIDIMFFLLASFMLVSMSMMKLQKEKIELPGATQGEAQKKQDFKVVGVGEKGTIYYDRDATPVSLETLTDKLAKLYAADKDKTSIFINCDKRASYNDLVTVLDAIRNVGIRNVNFAVQKEHTIGH